MTSEVESFSSGTTYGAGEKKEGERASTFFRIRMFGVEGTLSTLIKGTEGEAGADQGLQPWRGKGQRIVEPESI